MLLRRNLAFDSGLYIFESPAAKVALQGPKRPNHHNEIKL